MVERQLPKLHTRVRFPSPAPVPCVSAIRFLRCARSRSPTGAAAAASRRCARAVLPARARGSPAPECGVEEELPRALPRHLSPAQAAGPRARRRLQWPAAVHGRATAHRHLLLRAAERGRNSRASARRRAARSIHSSMYIPHDLVCTHGLPGRISAMCAFAWIDLRNYSRHRKKETTPMKRIRRWILL